MKETKALIINDVISEPRTFEISSEQAQILNETLSFELELQDKEGFGTMYALIKHTSQLDDGIIHALNHGAEWRNVWLFEGLNGNGIMRTSNTTDGDEFEKWLNEYFTLFFETCQMFCFFGEYNGDSYAKMHDYQTISAIFSLKEDALAFKKILDIIESDITFEEKRQKYLNITQSRKPVELIARSTMDFE